MRLIDPGPGELIDRETILVLKIKAASAVGKPTAHFEHELAGIRERLEPFRVALKPLSVWADALLSVNQLVWVAIDKLRAAGEDDQLAAHWGRNALYGNDERAKMIHKINEECGVSNGQEKIR